MASVSHFKITMQLRAGKSDAEVPDVGSDEMPGRSISSPSRSTL